MFVQFQYHCGAVKQMSIKCVLYFMILVCEFAEQLYVGNGLTAILEYVDWVPFVS